MSKLSTKMMVTFDMLDKAFDPGIDFHPDRAQFAKAGFTFVLDKREDLIAEIVDPFADFPPSEKLSESERQRIWSEIKSNTRRRIRCPVFCFHACIKFKCGQPCGAALFSLRMLRHI